MTTRHKETTLTILCMDMNQFLHCIKQCSTISNRISVVKKNRSSSYKGGTNTVLYVYKKKSRPYSQSCLRIYSGVTNCFFPLIDFNQFYYSWGLSRAVLNINQLAAIFDALIHLASRQK